MPNKRTIIGPVMISYPSLFEKAEMSGKFEVDILYEDGSPVHKQMAAIEAEAIKERWGDDPPKTLVMAVKVGDDKQNPSPDYTGKLYSKIRTNRRTRITDAKNVEIEEPSELRGGNICALSVSAFAYDHRKDPKKGRKAGVYLTLHGLKKLSEGTPLGDSDDDSFGYDDALDDFDASSGTDDNLEF